MKITLTIAGGLAPSLMAKTYVVDDRDLSEEQRQKLAAAIAAARAAPARSASSARDARSYDITIESMASDAPSAPIVAYDGATPPAVKTLIDLLKSLAK